MSRRVLVVEDEPDMRFLLKLALERGGFTVEEADSGEEALELIAQSEPDVVLLDLNLPGMNGFGVMEALRRRGTLDRVPVVMLTADPTPDLPARAEKAGCAYCFSKTDPQADLLAALAGARPVPVVPS